jgi:polyprenyl-phospho-N-acetylgalactosaminyl synthase
MTMDRSMADVAVIVPVYNEAPVIAGVLEAIMRSFPNVICVDDGSTDGSAAVISSLGVVVISHPFNLGQGAALQTGVEYARVDPAIRYFVTFDADGQHSVDDACTMIDVLRTEPVDVVLGSRFLGGGGEIPRFRKLTLKFAVHFTRWTSGVKLTDAHNGLRAFNRAFAAGLELQHSDMAHASEIIEYIGKRGFVYKEIPVTISYTDYSRSKGQSLLNAVNVAFDVLVKKVIK